MNEKSKICPKDISSVRSCNSVFNVDFVYVSNQRAITFDKVGISFLDSFA